MSGDLWWSNVKLIAHFDGPDIAFNEKQRAVQWDNRLTLSTAEKRFGASSLALPGLEGAGVVYYGGGSDVGDLGPNEFTIEFFFQREYSGSRVDYLVSSRLSDGVHGYSWGLLVDDQDRLIWRGDVRGTADVVLWATPDWPPGLWKHIAVTRSGDTLRCFIDGVQTYSGTGSANYRSPHPVFVGFNGTSGGVWPDGTRTGACHGYVDELRITSGGARYTSNFTPPTAPFPNEYGTGGGGGGSAATDPYWDNVTLLANWEGPSITTNPKNIPATYAGMVALDTAQKRFGASSLNMPGDSGSAVAFTGAGVGDLGGGDFTVEFFFQSTFARAYIGEPQYLVASTLTGDPASGSWGVMLDVDGNVVWRAGLHQQGGGNLMLAQLQAENAWAPGVWKHVAITRASGVLRCFVDGVQTGYSYPNSVNYNSTYPVVVGAGWVDGQGNYGGRAWGTLDELRLTRGTARYTTNFPPITTAFPTTGSGGGTPIDPYWNDVLLCLPMTGDNNSSTFTDFSPNPKNVSNSGSVRVSQAQSKYGGTSAYFDGAGWLDVTGMPANFLQGDFTIEGWVYYTGSSQQTFFNTAPHTVLGVSMNRDGTGKTLFLIGNGTGSWSGAVTSAGALAANSWHHIAVVRSGATSTLYHNGVAQGSMYETPGNLSGARIGAITLDSEIITGHIDDFRITKAARYLGDFNPETRDPYLSDVLLYVSGDGEVGSEAEDSGPLALSQTAVVDPVLIAEPPIPLFAGRKAMRFSGDNGAVFSSPQFLFPQSQDWTLECWVLYSVNQTANAETFFSMIPNGPGDAHALLARVASGFVGVVSYGGGEGGGDSWGSAGNWGFVVIEFFEGIGKVWVNGIYKFGFSGGNPPAFHLRDIALGLCPGVYGYDPGLNGYLAEVRLTKRARYRGATPPVPSGPFPSTAPVVPEPTTPAIRGNWNFDFRAKVSPETRKDLPPPASKNFPDRVREEVSTLLGKRGDALDKAVTVRDLVDGGIIQVRPGWQGGISPVGGFGPAFPQPVEAYEPDLTPPPGPTNFSATAGFGLVYLQTASPAFTMGHGYARTKVYGAKRAQGAQAPVFSDAVLVYEFTGTIGAMPSDPATTWHLWAKWRTKDGVDSAAPAGGTNGVVATTGQDPGVLIDTLTGQITQEMLYVDLSNRINLIDGPASLTNSVAARLAAEATARGAAISQESTTRQTQVDSLSQQISTITAGGGGNAAAIQAEITARTNADSALSSRIDTVVAQTDTNTAAIQTEVTARTNADSAMAAQIAVLQAASGNSEAIVNLTNLVNAKSANFVQGTAPTATKVNDLWIDTTNGGNLLKRWNGTAWVLADDARIGATASSVLTLQSAVSDPATGLTSKVSALEVSAGTQASQITGLKAQYTVKIDLNGYVAGFGLAANAPNDNSSATSSFAVRADRFYVGPPTNYSQEATPSGATAGQIWYRPSDKKFFAWSGTAWEPWRNSLPFIVQTTPQTINGVNVPAGVYMDTAFIKDATISSAMIANLTADKITAGYVSAALGVEGSIFAGNKFYIGGVAEYIFDPQNPARKTGILRVTNANVALDTDGAVFHVNSFKITQGSALTTATPFEVDGNGNVKIKNAYIGTITAGQINSNGLTIKSTSGATLLDATLNTPPWVVFEDYLQVAGSGVRLVADTTSQTNTRYIKSLVPGHGIELSSAPSEITLGSTGSEVASGAMGVAVNVTTSAAPLNGLSVALLANSVYRLTATIRFRGTSATTPTPVFGLRLPPGASGTAQITAQVGSASSVESRIANWPNGGDATATFSAIGAAGAGNQIATLDAVLTTGATPGEAMVLAGSGNGLGITVEAASCVFAQRIRRVTAPASSILVLPTTIAPAYAAEDRQEANRLPAPLSGAYISITFRSDGTWELLGVGNENEPFGSGSWLNPSGVVGAGAFWELWMQVSGAPPVGGGVVVGNDTASGFVQVSTSKSMYISAAVRDGVVADDVSVSVYLRPVGQTLLPAPWATFTLSVRAASISLV